MQQNMCHIFLFVAFLVATSLCDTSPLLTQRDIENLKRRVDWKVADYNENIFRGWNKDEFRTLLGDFEDDYVPPLGFAYLKPKLWNLPREIDWSYSYCVHGIRDQMTCGACWAFAAATVVSDRCCLQNRDFGWLSPQELISCDTIKNSGCKGGLAAEALQYISRNGLVMESCYPYAGKQESCPTMCKTRANWRWSHVCRCRRLVDCSGLYGIRACLKRGPVAVRMKVYSDFGAYKGGIYCRDPASTYMGGHAIRCVGYGEYPTPYLKCANSWGRNWGVDGYFFIKATEECGVRLTPRDAWTVEDCNFTLLEAKMLCEILRRRIFITSSERKRNSHKLVQNMVNESDALLLQENRQEEAYKYLFMQRQSIQVRRQNNTVTKCRIVSYIFTYLLLQ
eukprot:TRINITY_DN1497_c0_g1_i4.p1 TRINITY_DN1497_c0_g1~~TRINITY_DN1497_c0_g1_i4.p1  ORF type:complete len:394 (-),score=1.17 TRINITY_DN1497_c0_g1_i4:51-1232(-)